MTDTPSPPANSRMLVDRTWTEPGQRIHITMDEQHRAVVVFDGKGTMAGGQALMNLIDQLREEFGHGLVIAALVDMRKLDGAPLRVQFLLGKWLLTRKKQISKIAIFGGKPIEMGIARAVMTISGMGQKAHFGNHRADALRFLGWPEERYPG